MKNIFILSLLLLTGCVSQTVEKIQSDPENIEKALSVQKRVDAGINTVINERKNDTNYQTCVKNVNTLKELQNKTSLSRTDMAKIFDIWPYEGGYYWDTDVIYCNFDDRYKNKSLEQEIDTFCRDKYWRGNLATAVTLFPLRMTNELVAIGSLGIIPTILGTCRANGEGWLSDDSTTGFLGWCWKPGATWNYETCKQFIAGANHELGSNRFMEEKHYWQSKNNEKYVFNGKDIDRLTEKMYSYCQNPPQLNPYAKKLCKGDYSKGCLVDLDGVSVATFGTRGNGVIVSARLWGLELIISDQVFVYDNRDYYDGQNLKTDGYYYTYVGNYDDGLQKLPAFRRSQYKAYKKPNTPVEDWCEKRSRH